jgi:hypothetical protein
MVTASYAKARSELAKAIGLGQNTETMLTVALRVGLACEPVPMRCVDFAHSDERPVVTLG